MRRKNQAFILLFWCELYLRVKPNRWWKDISTYSYIFQLTNRGGMRKMNRSLLWTEFCAPPHSYVEALPPPPCDCMWRHGLSGGIRVWWGHKGRALTQLASVPLRRGRQVRNLSHILLTEERPSEHTVRRWPFPYPGERPHWEPIHVCRSRRPVCDTLSSRSRQASSKHRSATLGEPQTRAMVISGWGHRQRERSDLWTP